jgi:hypothetical protein
MKTIACFVFTLLNLTAFAQHSAKIKAGADLITKASLQGDYETLIDHTYPKAIAMSGGRGAMLEIVKKEMEAMKQNGRGFKFASCGEPGPVYQSGKELHSVVPQYIEMLYKDGYLSFNTSMLAISNDEGKTWSFLSVGNIQLDRIQKMFPNLNKNLQIIKSSEPVFHTLKD